MVALDSFDVIKFICVLVVIIIIIIINKVMCNCCLCFYSVHWLKLHLVC